MRGGQVFLVVPFAFIDAQIVIVAAKDFRCRPALLSGIPSELLSRYERLLRGKDQGAPLTPVENGCCGNCHMKVTLQTINQLSKGELESCDNCQHLLYATE